MMVTCYLSLGSNLGDRKKNIALALAALRADAAINVLKVSSVIETEPEGVSSPQPRFLNAVVKLKTSCTARQLLERIQQIETLLGRKASPRPKNFPRTIDIDILLYGDARVKEKDLEIPHPRMRERQFVLTPLKEIAGVTLMKKLHSSARVKQKRQNTTCQPLNIYETARRDLEDLHQMGILTRTKQRKTFVYMPNYDF